MYTKQELRNKVAAESNLVTFVEFYDVSPYILPEDTPENVIDAFNRIDRAISDDVPLIEKWLRS
jgi:hypothetical protein